MPWNPSSRRLTKPLNIGRRGDLQLAFNTMYPDEGNAILHGKINKWAKWKPVKSPKNSLGTEEERKYAGSNPNELGFAYGVRGGIGNVGSLLDLHERGFTYERPRGGSSEKFRRDDCVHPQVPTLRGYYADATCNLNGVPYINGISYTERINLNQERGLIVNITYTPAASHDQDSICIEDFLHNSSISILDCYPCILISTSTGKNFIHALYPGEYSESAVPVKLRGGYYVDSNTSQWYLTTLNSTLPELLQTNGIRWKWTVFLVNKLRLLDGHNETNISNWIEDENNDHEVIGGVNFEDGLWSVDFVNVPELVKMEWPASTSSLPTFMISDDVTTLDEGFTVRGSWTSEYRETVTTTVTAELYTIVSGGHGTKQDEQEQSITGTVVRRLDRALIFNWDDFHNIVRGPQDITYELVLTSYVTDGVNTDPGCTVRTTIVYPRSRTNPVILDDPEIPEVL